MSWLHIKFHPDHLRYYNENERRSSCFLIIIILTLNGEGQSHSNWYQIVQFSGVYHHTKFERKQSVYVQMQAIINDGVLVGFFFFLVA